MNVLREGGGAVDAVEVAIRILEDKEITNAGYGSNLSLNGTVECDATIVDHFGRSGAVGAVGQIQHPIHLARLILDYSTKPLSLRRVPPNLLAGPGATDFAESLQIPVLPHDDLISHAARERWLKWARDLKAADDRVDDDEEGLEDPPSGGTGIPGNHQDPGRVYHPAIYGNESQPYSLPQPAERHLHDSALGSANPPNLGHTAAPSVKRMNMDASNTPIPPHVTWAGQRQGNDGESARNSASDDEGDFVDNRPPPRRPIQSRSTSPQLPSPPDPRRSEDATFTLAAIPKAVLANTTMFRRDLPVSANAPNNDDSDPAATGSINLKDDINDTVGAIAVDALGNIAAGSSSGGIGMKHRGRIGPAALVGVGTAVIPVEAEDPDRTSVATVTSGTGEHMATTMAASTCANRLYSGTRKSKRGGSESTDDDSAVKGFVERDFMGHPSVKNSYSAGGIGVLGVKKSNDGIWLYFAHNTDSFAMASMSSEESKPRSVMSRTKENARVVSGGRSIKYHRGSTWPISHHTTWPPNGEASSPEQPAKRQKRTRVPPTGLPPPDPQSKDQSSNGSYKVAYESKMEEIYGSEPVIAQDIAGIRLQQKGTQSPDRV
ncbi:MAG: hypothetical protein Q9220_001708 [cf. Caloplaca sp. 1 TL-2023]